MRGILSSYLIDIWYGKTRTDGLQSGLGCMMIDSVVWAQYINATDTQTDSRVAITNATPKHCVGWQKVAGVVIDHCEVN